MAKSKYQDLVQDLAESADEKVYRQLVSMKDRIDLEKALRLRGMNARYLQEHYKDRFTKKMGGLVDKENRHRFYTWLELEYSGNNFERLHDDLTNRTK